MEDSHNPQSDMATQDTAGPTGQDIQSGNGLQPLPRTVAALSVLNVL